MPETVDFRQIALSFPASQYTARTKSVAGKLNITLSVLCVSGVFSVEFSRERIRQTRMVYTFASRQIARNQTLCGLVGDRVVVYLETETLRLFN